MNFELTLTDAIPQVINLLNILVFLHVVIDPSGTLYSFGMLFFNSFQKMVKIHSTYVLTYHSQ